MCEGACAREEGSKGVALVFAPLAKHHFGDVGVLFISSIRLISRAMLTLRVRLHVCSLRHVSCYRWHAGADGRPVVKHGGRRGSWQRALSVTVTFPVPPSSPSLGLIGPSGCLPPEDVCIRVYPHGKVEKKKVHAAVTESSGNLHFTRWSYSLHFHHRTAA